MESLKQNLPEQIMNLIETILNRIINYSQKNLSNLTLLEDKIHLINEYTINVLESTKQIQSRNSQNTSSNRLNDYSSVSLNYKIEKNDKNLSCRTPNTTNNIKSLSLNNYMITKLKRKLKQEHEKKKILELGYLEKIVVLKNQLNKYESTNFGHFFNQINNDSEFKIVTHNENKTPKNTRYKNNRKISNKIESNNNSKDNSSNFFGNNTTTNFSDKKNKSKNVISKKMNTKNLMDVNYFFKIPRNIQSKKKIFKNLYLRYDINEIKHEIEEGKKKIKFFRELSQK